MATDEKKRENREFLVVGWAPQAALLMKASVEKIEVMEPVIEAELGDAPPSVQLHSDHVGPEDTAAQRFARERPHEGDARLCQEHPPNLASRSPTEPQPGFDQPDTALVERALGGDAELRRISMHGRYPPSSLTAPMSRRSDVLAGTSIENEEAFGSLGLELGFGVLLIDRRLQVISAGL